MPKKRELSQVLRLLDMLKVSEIAMSNRVELSNTIRTINNRIAALILADNWSCHIIMLMVFDFFFVNNCVFALVLDYHFESGYQVRDRLVLVLSYHFGSGY